MSDRWPRAASVQYCAIMNIDRLLRASLEDAGGRISATGPLTPASRTLSRRERALIAADLYENDEPKLTLSGKRTLSESHRWIPTDHAHRPQRDTHAHILLDQNESPDGTAPSPAGRGWREAPGEGRSLSPVLSSTYCLPSGSAGGKPATRKAAVGSGLIRAR